MKWRKWALRSGIRPERHGRYPRRRYGLCIPWGLERTGGVNQAVANLYREISQGEEWEPIVLVQEWSFVWPEVEVVDERLTAYVRLWSPWSENRPWLCLAKWVLLAPLHMGILLSFVWRERLEVINFHYPSLSCFGIALLRFLGLFRGSLILSFHGLDLAAAKLEMAPRVLWWFVLLMSKAVVGCSEAFTQEVRRFFKNGKARVVAVHNGVNERDLLAKARVGQSAIPGVGERRYVLCVATWEFKKGLDVLLHAFGAIAPNNPGLALVLVGRPAGESERLKHLAGELGIGKDVFFYKDIPHAEIGKYFKQASVFCLPSRAEPFGIAVLEAGIFGLPVVASRVGGIPEIITDGDTGLLLEPGDSAALAAALQRVLDDSTLAERLGARLQARVTSEFTSRRVYDDYRALLS